MKYALKKIRTNKEKNDAETTNNDIYLCWQNVAAFVNIKIKIKII